MFGIGKICILYTVLIVLAVFVYYLVYTRRINKKIKSGDATGRRLADIPRMIMIAVIILSLLYCSILSRALYEARNAQSTVSRNIYAVIDASNPQDYQYFSYFGQADLKDASFAMLYSQEANAGYSKEVVRDGNFMFTVFKRTSVADAFHPDFLCYVEYMGEKRDDLFLYNSAEYNLLTGKADSGVVVGSGGRYIPEKLLYIGYMDAGNIFTIEMNLLDEESEGAYENAMQRAFEADEGNFPPAKDFAVERAKVDIAFPGN